MVAAKIPPRLKRPLRVLHCPDIVGGHAHELARAERAQGLDSWAVAFRDSPFGYTCDEILWPEGTSRFVREFKRWRLLGRALWHFDVIHFNFGKSFFPEPTFPQPGACLNWKSKSKNLLARCLELQDLRLLKRAGKKIVVTFQGDDARQGDVLERFAEWKSTEELQPGYYTPASDAHKRWKISEIARYADCIYALNPDLLRVLPSGTKFLPYANVDPRVWTVAPPQPEGQPPLVLHAPTHRGIKGTRYVLQAVKRLQDEGVPFRFELVEGLRREQAKLRYAQADLLIDQLLLGWYGGLAVELMCLGKPVICSVRSDDLAFVPAPMRKELPVIQASPATLHSVLKEWLTVRRHQLPSRGMQCRAFVERWHDPRCVAAVVSADY